MTTLLITGSYPPDVCGVGDYSYCLMNANNSKDWKLFYKKDWRLKNYHRYKREIAGISPDKIIIQYPTQGYGWSLLPFILMIHFTRKLGKNCILVYHEFSNRSKKAKFVENIALFFCKKLIVTNEFEKDEIRKSHKKIDIYIIKIFSNIEKVSEIKKFSERKYDFTCFGQIRPFKGIEEFIETVRPLNNYKKALVGMIPSMFEDYGTEIIEKAKLAGIEVILNLDNKDTSDLLNNTKFLILPFTDGILERRGSFLAGAVNGCLIVSTVGKYTTQALNEIITKKLPVKEGELEKLKEMINDEIWTDKYIKTKEYLEREIPQSWEKIVEAYNNL